MSFVANALVDSALKLPLLLNSETWGLSGFTPPLPRDTGKSRYHWGCSCSQFAEAWDSHCGPSHRHPHSHLKQRSVELWKRLVYVSLQVLGVGNCCCIFCKTWALPGDLLWAGEKSVSVLAKSIFSWESRCEKQALSGANKWSYP